MEKEARYIIRHKSRSLGLSKWVAVWLLLDRFHVPQFVMIVFYILFGIDLLFFIVYCIMYREQPVDLTTFLRDRHEEQQQRKTKVNLKPPL